MSSTHFKGKEALEHVIEARLKGKAASAEIHGTEMPGHYAAAADAAKETAFLLIVLWTLFTEFQFQKTLFIAFALALLVWKAGRSAVLGWARLERLHRLIEEERWEIEHHRPQEKEELRALYAAKGFSGKLLDEAVEVLMADDNRLLQVMLQEELGLSLESYEHPLKQAAGAFAGALSAALLMAAGLFLLPFWGAVAAAAIIIALASGAVARLEKNASLPAIVWNLAVAALASGAAYFAGQLLFKP